MRICATFTRAVVVMLGCWLPPASRGLAQEIDFDRYAWEFPVVGNIKGADDLVQELREEIQAVLDAGHLAPLNCRYGDLMPSPVESHFVYQEPGRIITTLAWAYPHLDAGQQAAVRRYVAAELEDRRFAPWGEYPMPHDVGARRELHPMDRVWGADVKFGMNRPALHTLYGLWLYGFRSGDRALVQSRWPEIRMAYTRRASQGNLYGTMGAHIAMARLAEKFHDAEIRGEALGNLSAQLQAGTNFATVENLCRSGYYREYYTPRTANARALYHGEMFLNISPEIGRYLHDHVHDAALRRHEEGKRRFPLWWLVQAPYFCRWTGDESVGLSPEAVGMIAPLERWLVLADAATLRGYTRSVPTGKGDCYWLEMLVQAIEAHGTLQWTDVRNDLPAR
ncbi:MAG TPA: hypothetical protein VN887_10765 [Candidatus Angelobacter sp.]|nr:hypothetical protein [Candidatus Angelobacter sp.]